MLIDSKIIGSDELDVYRSSKYQVKTIIPYSETPKMNTYLFDQDELTQFLEDSVKFSEFIISVREMFDHYNTIDANDKKTAIKQLES